MPNRTTLLAWIIGAASLVAKQDESQAKDAQNVRPNSVHTTTNTQPVDTNSGQQHNQPKQWPDKIADWVLSASPADWVLVYLGWRGIRAAIDTLGEIEKQSGTAKTSAEAALAEIALTKLQQRAWVGSNSIDVTVNAITPISFAVHFINSGPSPAHQCSHWGRLAFRQRDAPYEFLGPPEGLPVSRYVLHAGQHNVSLPIVADKALTGDQLEKIDVGELVLYVYGRVNYLDIFGAPHWSNFCSFYQPSSKSMLLADVHNETDS